jgi:protein-histidine pros-kinase
VSEETVQDHVSLFHTLVESAPDAMLVVDAGGRIVLANARTQALFLFAPDELIGRRIETLIPERYHRTHAQHRGGYVEDPRVRPMGAGLELYGRRRDGTEFPVEISLSPITTTEGTMTAAAVRDVTDGVRARQQLRLLLDTSIAVSEAHDLDAALLRVIRSVCEATGLSYGQVWLPSGNGELMLGPHWHRGEPGSQRFRTASEEQPFTTGEGSVWLAWSTAKPLLIRDVSSDPRFVRTQAARDAGFAGSFLVPIAGSDGPVAVMEFFMGEGAEADDHLIALVSAVGAQLGAVIERKRAVDALRDALDREQEITERLRELDRVKTTFLHAVSHDLRNPLATIGGFAETLDLHWGSMPEEQARVVVRKIVEGTHRVHRMLRDLLDLDRLSSGKIEPVRDKVDVRAIVDRLVGEVDLGEHPIQIESFDGEAEVDPGQVERIVENLVLNAARYTPAGTPIMVRLEPAEGGLLLTVEDEGPGVPDSIKATIFEAFKRGDMVEAPGSGIGLSLVARFAALHGGRAWVEDRRSGGSAFKVLLPPG